MQTKTVLIVLGLGLVLAAGVFFALQGPFPPSTTEDTAGPTPRSEGTGSAMPGAAPRAAGDAAAPEDRFRALREAAGAGGQPDAQAFFASPSAAEALAWLERTAVDEDVELHLSKALADACPPGERTIDVDRQRWFADRLDAYCGDFAFDPAEVEALERRFMRDINLGAGELAGEIANMTMEEQDAFLRDAIANAESWSDLEIIKVTLESAYHLAPARDRQGPAQLHQLGQDPAFAGEQGQRIHRNALTLLQCVNYVDCGPDSIVTLQECYANPVCEPGWSIYDLLYNTSSPLEDEQVLSVLEQLLALRRDTGP